MVFGWPATRTKFDGRICFNFGYFFEAEWRVVRRWLPCNNRGSVLYTVRPRPFPTCLYGPVFVQIGKNIFAMVFDILLDSPKKRTIPSYFYSSPFLGYGGTKKCVLPLSSCDSAIALYNLQKGRRDRGSLPSPLPILYIYIYIFFAV